MKTWFLNLWDQLRTNFWFVPTTMLAGAVALSLATIQLDRMAGHRNWIATLGWTYTRGPEGSRAVLSVVAGSMATIAGVIFSITIVALQLASSQFGPRLLRNFIRDRGNQVALGAFVATFTFCLLILRTVNGTERDEFVPHISVTVGLLLALASLGVLIYFVHHAATSIQAENVIARVGRELHHAIDRLFPEELGQGPAVPERPEEGVPGDFDRRSRPIAAPRSDYLQVIDNDALMRLAVDRDLILRVESRPGKFVLEGSVLVRAWPGARVDEELAAEIRRVFSFGGRRTLAQDVEFAVDQLVEIAVRALSPGVNDPFTAIACVDRLGAMLVLLIRREFPSAYRCDDRGRLRVIADAVTPAGLVDAAFHQIRQSSRANAAVTLHLLETIAAVAAQARDEAFRMALRHHADLVHRGSQGGLPEQWDRAEAERRYRQALEALGTPPDPGPAAGTGG